MAEMNEKKERGFPLGWLLNNWGLKLSSLVFAAMLWFLVTNITNPVIRVTRSNIPVTFRNTSVITDAGQVYEVLDNTDTVSTVTIMARRNVADTLSASSISAVADFNQLTNRDTVPITFSVNASSSDVESVSGSIDAVKLSIENRRTKTVSLSASTSGELEDGYIVGRTSVEQNALRITGPESVIERIVRAAADVDVTGFVSDIGTDAEIRLYDAEDNVVNESSVQQSISTVRVNVTILPTRQVGIDAIIRGTPAAGYMVSGDTEISPAQVMIAGKSDALSRVTAIALDDESLDLTGQEKDLTVTLDLSDFLPSEISFADSSFDGSVTVRVPVEPVVTRTLNLPLSQISISNVPEGYDVELGNTRSENAPSRIGVTLMGTQAQVDAVTAGQVSGDVDMDNVLAGLDGAELVSGVYRVNVTMTLPEGVNTAAAVLTDITVTRHGEEEPEEGAAAQEESADVLGNGENNTGTEGNSND